MAGWGWMALPSCVSFMKTLEIYVVKNIEGECSPVPFLCVFFFSFLSGGTYLLLCDLITVFLNVINAYVGVASPKTLSSCIQQFLL